MPSGLKTPFPRPTIESFYHLLPLSVWDQIFNTLALEDIENPNSSTAIGWEAGLTCRGTGESSCRKSTVSSSILVGYSMSHDC